MNEDVRRTCGGDAFPSAGYSNGLTALDYFAGQALAGLLTQDGDRWKEPAEKTVAVLAYQIAAEMLVERNKVKKRMMKLLTREEAQP